MTSSNERSRTAQRVGKLSPAAARWLGEAGTALGRGQLEVAEQHLTTVLAVAPTCAEALRLMGVAAQMRGYHAVAVDYLREALGSCPDDATVHMNLGSALYETGAIEAALASLRHACALAPELAACWYNLGKALKLQMNYGEAYEALQRALSIDPAHALTRLSLADTQIGLGDVVAAVRNYREVLRRQPGQALAWFSLANLKTESFTAADAAVLAREFRRTDASIDARIQLGFALAKAVEDQGDYPVAFAVLQQANALKRRTLRWDQAAEHARVNAIMQSFATRLSAPLDPALGHEVIFIVSLPRAGSTLTEQILAAHPEVEGANEITDLPQVIEDESKRRGQPFPHWVNDATAADWSRLGHDYLARTAHWRKERPRFTDKNLVTWQLVGAITAMLPGARVINCHRDALETCFACYRQLFSNGAHFSYDLTEMGAQFLEYARLSAHWQQLFPGRILDHSHESLLADPEAGIRRLLDFCGLEFDGACLAPHLSTRTVRSTASAAQVRQPLHAVQSRTACYGDQLKLLHEQLRDAGVL